MLAGSRQGGYPPWEYESVPKNRREDRHAAKARIIRPIPAELWEQLGEKAGHRKRNEVISELIAMYLEGEIVLRSEKAPPAEA